MEDNDIIKQVLGTEYPNEIARLRVSVPNLTVTPVTVFTNSNMPRKEDAMGKKKANKNASGAKAANDTVEELWKCMGLSKIDISYACVGYAFDGSPILDHDDFVELLMAYGFSIDTVMAFVDDFAEHTKKDGNSPIIMFRKNVADIRSNVEPLFDDDKNC